MADEFRATPAMRVCVEQWNSAVIVAGELPIGTRCSAAHHGFQIPPRQLAAP